MTAYCNVCKCYVNQRCNKCNDNFGVEVCEKYACGGQMVCPGCRQSKLSLRKDFGIDPYDFVKNRKDTAHAKPAGNVCSCGFKLVAGWKFCAMCGKVL